MRRGRGWSGHRYCTAKTVTVSYATQDGTATVNNDNTITYKPGKDENGPDSYVYKITDADGQISTEVAGSGPASPTGCLGRPALEKARGF